MISNASLPKVLCAAIVFAALCVPGASHAASVSWSQTEGALKSPDNAFGNMNASMHIPDPVMSFQYRAYIRNMATGEIVPPGGTVSVGTQLSLSFDTHQSSDISWFGTGGAYDSPYGEWRQNATAPSRRCHKDDFIRSGTSQSNGGFGYGPYSMYANFAVSPPSKSLTGTQGLTCGPLGADGSAICTASGAGTIPVTFVFGATQGKFYPQLYAQDMATMIKQCRAYNSPMTISHKRTPFVSFGTALPIPAQAIEYPINVADPNNTAPSRPSVSGLSVVSGNSSCLVGAPYTLRFSSTDAENDRLRYLIDWDDDGSADQVVPPGGYLSSGLAASADRTFTMDGTKTVRVAAADENGGTSEWISFGFTCMHPPESGDDTGSGSGASGGGGNGSGEISAALTFRAAPLLVQSGNTTMLRWDVAGASSCSISGTNGDAFPVSGGSLSNSGEQRSSEIVERTTYTLTCIEPASGQIQTANVTVNIAPIFNSP